MDDYVDLRLNPETDVITRKQKELPYELKDFQVDLNYQERIDKELKDNYYTISNQEKLHIEKMNKKIYTLRFKKNILD